jgi:DNA-binding NarL/FixJ family response regulator
MIRLFSIEDHWLVTDGLRTKFRKSRNEVTISCSATTIEDALKGKSGDAFDIILLDLFLPGTEPVDNIKRLMGKYPGKPVVILSGEEQEIWKMQAAEAGVSAYLTKHATRDEMIDTLKRVFSGENILRDQMACAAIDQTTQTRHWHLFRIKPSEKELLRQLAKGVSQKQVAGNLHLSESAIEKTLGKLRTQFSAHTTLELIRTLEGLHYFTSSDLPGDKI